MAATTGGRARPLSGGGAIGAVPAMARACSGSRRRRPSRGATARRGERAAPTVADERPRASVCVDAAEVADERAAVGTAYKQEGRRRAVQLGLEITGPKLAELAARLESLAGGVPPRSYCWRGGMR